PAPGEQGGLGAGARAEVRDRAGRLGPDARGELQEGPGALVLEPQVLLRAPRVRHHRPSLSEYLDLKISAERGGAQCGDASPGAGAAGALSRLELAEALRAGQGVGRLEQSGPEGEQGGVTGRP